MDYIAQRREPLAPEAEVAARTSYLASKKVSVEELKVTSRSNQSFVLAADKYIPKLSRSDSGLRCCKAVDSSLSFTQAMHFCTASERPFLHL